MLLGGLIFSSASLGSSDTKEIKPEASHETLLKIPRHLPAAVDGKYFVTDEKTGEKVELTLDPDLQEHMATYVKTHGNHVAALVVAEVETGNIIAFVQGKAPKAWGTDVLSALHTSFPAASLFKLTSTAASIEALNLNSKKATGLRGGCGKVHPQGVWLKDQKPSRNYRMSLKRAFALSCNGYYAQLGVKELGLGPILHYADKLGWKKRIPSDFDIPVSPMQAPSPTSSVGTVGRFSAGFGLVGMSAAHSAWQMLAIANDGNPIPIRITKDRPAYLPPWAPVVSKDTAEELRSVMRPTTLSGTATYAFKKRRYRRYKHLVGGKTGTLTGRNPKGLTTWFSGMMPINDPKIVVAAVVVVGDKWIIKGPHLAAEAFRQWDRLERKRSSISKNKSKRKAR